jgi:hypothetical protein
VKYLLDTNVISELQKGARCDPHVVRWYGSVDNAHLHVSVLVLGEIRKGVDRIRTRDAARARSIERWLQGLIESYGDRIVPIDRDVAEEWGRLNGPRPLPVIDSLLGATVNVHGMTLVTRNVRDLAGTGVKLLDPFEPPPIP